MSIQTAFRLDEALHEALHEIAKDGRPMKWHVEKALTQYLQSPTQSPPSPLVSAPPKKAKAIAMVDDTDNGGADFIIDKINAVSGRKFKKTKTNRAGISERIKEYCLEDCMQVVDNMWSRWKGDEKMEHHFNPSTLFRPKHFDKYLNAGIKQEAAPKPKTGLDALCHSIAEKDTPKQEIIGYGY